jgi:hypothetical protein
MAQSNETTSVTKSASVQPKKVAQATKDSGRVKLGGGMLRFTKDAGRVKLGGGMLRF